jgi:TonB family protein
MSVLRLHLRFVCQWTALVLGTCSGGVLRAQTALYAEHNGDMARVRQMRQHVPFVDDGKGSVVRPTGKQLALRRVPEYLPYFVSIRNVDAHASSMTTGGGSDVNNKFYYAADLQSPYALKNVFILLDMSLEHAGHTYLIWEVGDLEPYRTRRLELDLSVPGEIGSGNYYTHLYSNGEEVFNSTMEFGEIEGHLDEMVMRRIENVTDAKPRPFVGPFPEITSKIRGRTGHVVVRCSLSPHGRVIDATVKSATDPALGEAALAVARQWRFFPKVVAGAPVASTISVPFDFPPQ